MFRKGVAVIPTGAVIVASIRGGAPDNLRAQTMHTKNTARAGPTHFPAAGTVVPGGRSTESESRILLCRLQSYLFNLRLALLP